MEYEYTFIETRPNYYTGPKTTVTIKTHQRLADSQSIDALRQRIEADLRVLNLPGEEMT